MGLEYDFSAHTLPLSTGPILDTTHNGAAALDEAPSKAHIGHVGELVV